MTNRKQLAGAWGGRRLPDPRKIALAALSCLLALLLAGLLPEISHARKSRPSPRRHKQIRKAVKPPSVHGLALVIGSGKLNGELRLPGASGAACVMGSTLSRLGFKVTRIENPARNALRRALTEFAAKARHADVAVIYYAGLTAAWRGRNRLLPSDIRLNSPRLLLRGSLPLDGALAALRRARRYGVLMLDGGYELPALNKLKKHARRHSVSGMAAILPPPAVAALLAVPPGRARPVGDEEGGRMAIAVARELGKITTPHPAIEVFGALARRLAGEKAEKTKILFIRKQAKRRARRARADRLVWSTWDFTAPAESGEDMTVFQWQADEQNPVKQYEKCRKMAVIMDTRARAARACKRVLGSRLAGKDALSRYESLEKEFPYAPCLDELHKRRTRIREAQAWRWLARAGDIKALENFIRKYPDGKYIDKARKKLKELVELRKKQEKQSYYLALGIKQGESGKAAGDGSIHELGKGINYNARIAALRTFLEQYPDGDYAAKARQKIHELEQESKEYAAFRKAAASKNIDKIERFIELHPHSRFVGKAHEAISSIRKRMEREKQMWAQIEKGEADLDLVRAYITDYPDSTHIEKARERLAILEKKEKRRKAAEACREKFSYENNDTFMELTGEEGDYTCVFDGVAGKRRIPLKTIRYHDWYYEHSGGSCRIWSYPVDVSGDTSALSGAGEPVVSFKRASTYKGSSMYLNLTSTLYWGDPASIHVRIYYRDYKVQGENGRLIPASTGGNTVSDKITHGLSLWGEFAIHGPSANGRELELKFSSVGFTRQFHRMAQDCGESILSWIEDWAAISRGGGAFQWSTGHRSADEAKESVLQYCRSLGHHDCYLALRPFRNRCFAVYNALSGGWNIRLGKTVEEAEQAAAEDCADTRGGCYLSMKGCADGSNEYVNRNPPRPTLTFKFTSTAPYSVSLKFFSQSRNSAWPGWDRVYILEDGVEQTFKLGCRWGEKICWGAWPYGSSSSYWGCGRGCREYCANCCYSCDGTSATPIRLR